MNATLWKNPGGHNWLGVWTLYMREGNEDETEILSYAIPLFCSIGADVRHKLACFKI